MNCSHASHGSRLSSRIRLVSPDLSASFWAAIQAATVASGPRSAAAGEVLGELGAEDEGAATCGSGSLPEQAVTPSSKTPHAAMTARVPVMRRSCPGSRTGETGDLRPVDNRSATVDLATREASEHQNITVANRAVSWKPTRS